MAGQLQPIEGEVLADLPLDALASWEASPLFANSRNVRYNPDDLVGRKGLQIYGKMREDEQVKAVTVFKRDAITARGWMFKFEDGSDLDSDEQERRIAVFTQAVCRMRGSFEDALNCIATGREYGFSLTEKSYSKITVKGETFVGINKLKNRDPSTFEFYTDEYGELITLRQRVNAKVQDLDIKNFIHYVHAPEFDPYFGRSDLREAYRSWFSKDAVIKMWMVYLERFAGGFAVASRGPDSNVPRGSQAELALQAVLRNLKGASGILLPKGVELDVVMPGSTDQYEKAVTYHDLAIAKALLVPNLLGISHAGQTGSYSQSQTQFDAFLWTLNADSKRLEACLNEQLFRDLGDQNFGDGEYPQFEFKPASLEHLKWTLGMWKDLVQVKAVTATGEDEAYLRSMLNMPEREVEAEAPETETETETGDLNNPNTPAEDGEAGTATPSATPPNAAAPALAVPAGAPTGGLPDPAALAGAAPMADVQKTALNGAQVTSLLDIVVAVGDTSMPPDTAKAVLAAAFPSMTEEQINGIIDPIEPKEPPPPPVVAGGLPGAPKPGQPANAAPAQPNAAQPATMGKVVAHTHDGKPRTVSVAAFNRAVQRVNFTAIENKTQSIAARGAQDLSNRMAKGVQYAVGNPQDFLDEPTRIQDARLTAADVGKLKQLAASTLKQAYVLGRDVARNELDRAKGAVMDRSSFASLRDNAADYFEASGFRMAGNLSDGARAIIQQELQNGVKYGRSPQETKAQIWDRLTSKGFTNRESVRLVEDDSAVADLLDALWIDTEDAAQAYINTLVRTNTFEALNEARYAEFTDPAVADFVVGLEYSAVLDESTTEICNALDGVTLNADNESWDKFRPPNHYNCRSLLIPVTTLDGWDGTESDIPDVEPQDGF